MPATSVSLDVPAGAGAGVALDVSGWPSRKLFFLAASPTEKCSVEASSDGLSWAPAFLWLGVVGVQFVVRDLPVNWLRFRRAKVGTVLPSVQVCAYVTGGAPVITSVSLPPPVGLGAGAAVNVSALSPSRLIIADGGPAEVYRVEISGDGTTWYPLFSSATPGDRLQASDLPAVWARVVRLRLDLSAPLVIWMASDPASAGGGGGPPAAHRTTHFSGGSDAMETAVYPVWVGGPYASVTAAIAAAIADGHTDNLNPAIVRVYPKPLGWAEDVALSAGIHIEGVSDVPYGVWIRSLSYTPGAGLDDVSGIVQVRGIRTYAAPALEAIALLGANFGRLICRNCVLSKPGLGVANVRCNNTGVSGADPSELDIIDCLGSVPAGGTAYHATAGLLTVWRSDISRATAGRALLVDGGALVQMTEANLVSAGADVVRMDAGAALLVDCIVRQLGAGADGVVFNNLAANLTAVGSLLAVPAGAGYAARGVGTFIWANNAYAANVKAQNTLASVPLAILPVATP